MIELFLASGNKHKAQEFNQLIDGKICLIKESPKTIEVEESGLTYYENALIKARAYYKVLKQAVVSDDSGLNVEYLPDQLGVHSARFGGDNLTSSERIDLLLKKLENVPEEKRGAFFSSILCLYFSDEEYYFFEGKVEGRISFIPRGEFGFGYDPVFLPTKSQIDGASLAELPEWKNQNSHRANACHLMQKFLQERYCKN